MSQQEIQLFIAGMMALAIVAAILILLFKTERKDEDEKKSLEAQYIKWAESDTPEHTEALRLAILKI